MPETPEYLAAEKRRNANRERALLNLPRLTRPVDVPTYCGVVGVQTVIAFCSVGCGFAALICFFEEMMEHGYTTADGVFFAAVLVCLGVWGIASTYALELFVDIARDCRMNRAMTTRIMELAEYHRLKDLPPEPPPAGRTSARG